MSEKKDQKEKIVKKRPFGDNGRIQGATGGSTAFSDASDTYANKWDNFIQFTSTISNTSVKFKAFLTDFSDEYQSEWNTEQVYGRNDPIQTFRNTTRTISLGWDCPAGSVFEARTNMRAAADLIKMLYPGYLRKDNVSTLNRAPVIKVKFRNLIQDLDNQALYVTLSGLTFAPDLDAGFFDHDPPAIQKNRSLPEAAKEQLMPKLLRFSCTMTVLHRETIGWNGSDEWPDNLSSFPNLPPHLGIGTFESEAEANKFDQSRFSGIQEDFNADEEEAVRELEEALAATAGDLELSDKQKTRKEKKTDRLQKKATRQQDRLDKTQAKIPQ
jgi:hypothetical protein